MLLIKHDRWMFKVWTPTSLPQSKWFPSQLGILVINEPWPVTLLTYFNSNNQISKHFLWNSRLALCWCISLTQITRCHLSVQLQVSMCSSSLSFLETSFSKVISSSWCHHLAHLWVTTHTAWVHNGLWQEEQQMSDGLGIVGLVNMWRSR